MSKKIIFATYWNNDFQEGVTSPRPIGEYFDIWSSKKKTAKPHNVNAKFFVTTYEGKSGQHKFFSDEQTAKKYSLLQSHKLKGKHLSFGSGNKWGFKL